VSPAAETPGGARCVLVTGASGLVGSQVVGQLAPGMRVSRSICASPIQSAA